MEVGEVFFTARQYGPPLRPLHPADHNRGVNGKHLNSGAAAAPRVVLKQDGFGRMERVETESGPLAVRVPCGSRTPGSRWVARLLARREQRAIDHLVEFPGLAGRIPRPVSVPDLPGAREFLDGEPLWRAPRLPRDYFELLGDLVRELHAAGVCHNDLHKEPNILVLPDGRPGLIDFQLASVHTRPNSRSSRVRRAEDLRHIDKHRRRYERRGAPKTERDRAGRAKRSLLSAGWRRFGKPVYNSIVHGLFGQPSSEPRRPESGPWPEWTAPLGAGVSPAAGERGERASRSSPGSACRRD